MRTPRKAYAKPRARSLGVRKFRRAQKYDSPSMSAYDFLESLWYISLIVLEYSSNDSPGLRLTAMTMPSTSLSYGTLLAMRTRSQSYHCCVAESRADCRLLRTCSLLPVMSLNFVAHQAE